MDPENMIQKIAKPGESVFKVDITFGKRSTIRTRQDMRGNIKNGWRTDRYN